ncbi:MAG: DUF2384 domain-containing protein [Myxococcales bacterium]
MATPALAEEIRDEFGAELPVEVAPTPEADAVAADLYRSLARGEDEEPSYLDGGRLPEPGVRRLFGAAAELFRRAPWKRFNDSQLIQVDVPELGLEGACVSVIGAMKQSYGFVLFPSMMAFEIYAASTANGLPEDDTPIDLGTSHMALNFEKRGDVPEAMQKEVASQAWPLAAHDAYPVWMCVDRDAVGRPIEPLEIDRLAAISLALAELFERHGDALERGESAEASAVLPDSPATATARFPFRPSAPKPSLATRADAAEQSVEVESRVTLAMWGYAFGKFGKRWQEVTKSVKAFQNHVPFSIPWSVYRYRVQGRRLVEWYLEEQARLLNEPERAWLEAQSESWLGAWEIEAVTPGEALDLRDLLTGERRRVVERRGSVNVERGHVLYSAVVRFRGAWLLAGTYTHYLAPVAADEVVSSVCRALKVEPGAVPVALLREQESEKLLLAAWQKAVRENEKRREAPVRLCNSDGDPLLFTQDCFGFPKGERAAIEARLLRAFGEDAQVDEGGGEAGASERCFAILGEQPRDAEMGRSVLGRVVVGEDGLRLETNSVRRADALRRRVEEACGKALVHRLRDHVDPTSAAHPKSSKAERKLPPMTPEMLEALREHKAQHYRAWMDQKLPALGGKTPRQAASSKEGRSRVEALLKELEQMERRLPEAERADVAALRRELLG